MITSSSLDRTDTCKGKESPEGGRETRRRRRRRTKPTPREGGKLNVDELGLEKREGSGPWDGPMDPELGNTCARKFMKWYRQRLDLSLHQVAELTGIDRTYLRRVERRRIHLSLIVLWRWANGLHVNVDWVLRIARRRALELV